MDHNVGREVHSRSYYDGPSRESVDHIEQRVTNLEQEIRSLRDSIDTLVRALQNGMQR